MVRNKYYHVIILWLPLWFFKCAIKMKFIDHTYNSTLALHYT